jgi:hypothetical protein
LPVLLHNITGIPVLLGAALWILGCISMLRRTPMGLILLVSPLAALAAAVIRSYPFYDRFLLFALPGVCLFVGEGVETLRGSLARLKPALGLVALLALGILLFYYPLSQAWQNFRQPEMVEHLKPVLAYVQHSRRPGELIYVYYGAQHAFIYYAEQFGIQEDDYFFAIASRRQPGRYLEQLDVLKGKRVWFVFSHNCSWCQVDEQVYIIDHLDAMGTRLDEMYAPGAAGYLYDLR